MTRRVTVELFDPAYTRMSSTKRVESGLMLQPTVSRQVCLGIQHPSWTYYHAGLLMWGILSEERTGVSFTIAAGPHQSSHSYFTVSDSRLPFSSPPTTRREMVEVFDLACTLDAPAHQCEVEV
jgi:hypothetical protein